jgi:hypothetical protein
MRKYFTLVIDRLWDHAQHMAGDLSQHRRHTTRYEDLCM